MSISGVSSTFTVASAPVGMAVDTEIQALQNSKLRMQQMIEKVKAGKDDPETKMKKVQDITTQIEATDMQIRQKRLDNAKKDQQSKAESTTDSSASESNAVSYSAGMAGSTHMMSAVSGYKELQTMGAVRTDLIGDLRIATNSGENPSAGQGIQEKIDGLESDMTSNETKIRGDLKKASKDAEKASKAEQPQPDTARKEQTDSAGDVADTSAIPTTGSTSSDAAQAEKTMQRNPATDSKDTIEKITNDKSNEEKQSVLPKGKTVDRLV